ncbi:hypothetical protein [Bifidobacterium leontopitheci]|nr:hypothetical protein [Bifidobacterium leontopitheci]
MTRKNFVSMILGAIGGVLFALGMCMGLLPQWHAFGWGVTTGVIGLMMLIAIPFVRRAMSGRPVFTPLRGRTVAVTALAVAGALVLGVGMCMTMIWDMLVPGVVVGLAGIVMLLALIPLCKGLKD